MKFKQLSIVAACVGLACTPAFAEDSLVPGLGQVMSAGPVAPAPAPAPAGIYEGGRGLITTEGPSGLFINPTSGTMPAHAATLQYCFLLPTNDFSEVMGHGMLLGYGVTDFIEIGAIANYIDFDQGDDPSAVGPYVRARLLKDSGFIPEVSIGYYGKFGDDALDQQAIFAALFKRIPIGDESGVVKSFGVHTGVRQVWDTPEDDETFQVYGGVEMQLPLRFYLVGEVSTDNKVGTTPYAYGVQWRLGGVNISVAGVQAGNFDEDAFYFGIGSQMSF